MLPPLLVWDAYRCHLNDDIRRAECKKLRFHTATVPGGTTKFIQAADVVWNSCFKSHTQSCYDTWLSEPSLHKFTKCLPKQSDLANDSVKIFPS